MAKPVWDGRRETLYLYIYDCLVWLMVDVGFARRVYFTLTKVMYGFRVKRVTLNGGNIEIVGTDLFSYLPASIYVFVSGKINVPWHYEDSRKFMRLRMQELNDENQEYYCLRENTKRVS